MYHKTIEEFDKWFNSIEKAHSKPKGLGTIKLEEEITNLEYPLRPEVRHAIATLTEYYGFEEGLRIYHKMSLLNNFEWNEMRLMYGLSAVLPYFRGDADTEPDMRRVMQSWREIPIKDVELDEALEADNNKEIIHEFFE